MYYVMRICQRDLRLRQGPQLLISTPQVSNQKNQRSSIIQDRLMIDEQDPSPDSYLAPLRRRLTRSV